MGTVAQAYEKYIVKAESNATNDGISTDKAKFVLRYNESQNRFLEGLLDKKGEDDIRYAQKFLVHDKTIPYVSQTQDYTNFTLPPDYLDKTNVYGLATQGECIRQKMFLFEIKDDNQNDILKDEDNKPSFKWRESPYSVNSDLISVYRDGFTNEKIVLSYYRYPQRIEQIDPLDPESPFNEDKKIEWDDKSLDRIITLCVAGFQISGQNPSFQASKQEAQQKT